MAYVVFHDGILRTQVLFNSWEVSKAILTSEIYFN